MITVMDNIITVFKKNECFNNINIFGNINNLVHLLLMGFSIPLKNIFNNYKV